MLLLVVDGGEVSSDSWKQGGFTCSEDGIDRFVDLGSSIGILMIPA